MTRVEAHHSRQLPARFDGSSFLRHFPTICLACDAGISAWKSLSVRRRPIVNAAVLVSLVIVILYAWWEAVIGPQRDAVAAITRVGGSVSYDWQWRNGRAKATVATPPWPAWLVEGLGPHCFGHVVSVNLAGENATDGVMMQIGRLSRLQHLDAGSALGRGSGVNRLWSLTPITGAGLAGLKRLTALETLELPEFPFSDRDLAHLAALKKLRTLNLYGQRITNAALAHLAGMRQMEVLRLRETRITTLEPIRGLVNLRHLDLSGSPIGNDGLTDMADFSNLQRLDLSETTVTAAGLARLSRKAGRGPFLTIVVSGTDITPEEAAELESRLPGKRVIGADLIMTAGASGGGNGTGGDPDGELPK